MKASGKRGGMLSDAPKLFLLGCERSGSTWLSNIFDSHPDVFMAMEPFAPFAQAFPGFPDRNTYMGPDCAHDPGREELRRVVEAGYTKLADWKYPLLYGLGRRPILREIDRQLVNGYERAAWFLRARPGLMTQRYQALNLSRKAIPSAQDFRKSGDVRAVVTKELRLNFKTRMLSDLFPESRYVIAVRSPAAQITSIARFFDEGGLHELRLALMTLADSVSNSIVLSRYSDVVRAAAAAGDRVSRLAAWWAVNYDNVIRDLRASGAPYLVVRHEDLSERPLEVVENMFEFAGLEVTPAVTAYVAQSSSRAGDPRNPLDTTRLSSAYYRSRLEDAEGLWARIAAVLRNFEPVGELSSYFESAVERALE